MRLVPNQPSRSVPFSGRLADALSGANAVAYCLVLPAILLRLGFTLAPAIQTFWLSFTDKSLMASGRFVGLANYAAMLSDKTLIASLGFTIFYTAASVAAETGLGLLIALLLMRQVRAKWISNFIMLLPWVMAPLLAATVWKIMFYEDGGILNQILRDAGIIASPIRWLSDANTARFSVILVTVWKNVSWVALIFMAALAALPKDVYEAAEVDGTNAVQRFRYITVPMLRPTIFLVLMFRGMGEVQTFEQIGGLTRGGPGTATQNLAYYAYQRFFQELRYGYGSAIDVLLLLLTALIGGFFAWRMYKASSR